MKRIGCLALCLLLLAGCASGGSEEEYTLYCRASLSSGSASGADAVYPLTVQVEGADDTALAEALLEELLRAGGEDYESPLPQGTQVQSVTIESGLATVDLSGAYTEISDMELTLADACITLSLCQLPSVERVSVLAEGKPLPYRNQQILSADDLLLSGMDEVVRTLRVRLFFPDEDTGELLYIGRTLQLYEDQTAVEAVLEALLAGPGDDRLRAVVPEGTEVLSGRVDEGICYVNLSQAFLEERPQSLQEQKNVVYSIVRSLCSLSDVQAVQIAVEGENIGSYGAVDVSVPLS